MIQLPIGSTMGFSGGAESTPIATIGRKAEEPAFLLNVYGRSPEKAVCLSESEALSLIEWAKGKAVGDTEALSFGVCTVKVFEEVLSLNCGSSQVLITQNGCTLRISTETLARVIAWGREECPWLSSTQRLNTL